MKRFLMALLFATSALPLAAQAIPDGFLLLHDPDYVDPVGLEGVQRLEMKMAAENLKLNLGEVELGGTMKSTASEEMRGKSLGRDKFRYLLAKSETKTVVTIGGQEQVEPGEEEPLLKVPVIIEKKDGKWEARLEEGEPNDDQKEKLRELEKKAARDSDADLYGRKPRRIGETWEVDAAALEEFREEADEVEGKITLTLKGEKKLQGQRVAVLEGSLDALMVMKGKGDDDPDTKIHMKGKLTLLRSLTYDEDIAMELEGTMKLELDLPGPDGPIKMVGSGPYLFKAALEFK